jgi:hypothetical protein
MQHNKNHTAAPKRDWVQPELRRLEAGAAESQRGATPDGGGGNQGS